MGALLCFVLLLLALLATPARAALEPWLCDSIGWCGDAQPVLAAALMIRNEETTIERVRFF